MKNRRSLPNIYEFIISYPSIPDHKSLYALKKSLRAYTQKIKFFKKLLRDTKKPEKVEESEFLIIQSILLCNFLSPPGLPASIENIHMYVFMRLSKNKSAKVK